MKRQEDIPERTVRRFIEQLPHLLCMVNERFLSESEAPGRDAFRENLSFLLDAHRHFSDILEGVYLFKLFGHFQEELAWYFSLVHSRGLGRSYFDLLLKTWIISIHSRLGPLDARLTAAPLEEARQWLQTTTDIMSGRGRKQAGEGDFEEPEAQGRKQGGWLEQSAPEKRFDPEKQGEPEIREQMVSLLLEGNHEDAAGLLEPLLENGVSLEQVCSFYLLGCEAAIGDRWQRNRITVADEHIATAALRLAVHRFFDRLEESSSRPEQKPDLHGPVVLGCAPGDLHELGVEVLSRYLRVQGWPVLYAGHGTPARELARGMKQRRPAAVVLSATMISHLPGLYAAARELRDAVPGAGILLTGRAAVLAAERLGDAADAVVSRFDDVQDALNRAVERNA
jgi:methanogenic corrinoid protein MtbC1